MSTQLFAVNKTNSHLLLKNGYVRIDQGGYKSVREADLEHPDFLEARERGFIEVTDKEPTARSVAGITAVEYAEPYRGLTAAELKAVQAKEGPKPSATSEPIGKPAPVADAEVPAEPAAKAGRKAAAKAE